MPRNHIVTETIHTRRFGLERGWKECDKPLYSEH